MLFIQVFFTFGLHSWLTGATDLDFVPNDGDLVVEAKGGNYHFVEEDGVLILTRENFHYYVMSRPMVLVEFYAPWCGHCKELAPEYAKAAEWLKKDNVTLAKVDGTKEAELAKEMMISGYPTIILYQKGRKVEEYRGKRTATGLVDYVREKTDPDWKPPASPVIVLTSENFTKAVRDVELMLVEFYAPWCKHCQQLEPEYEAAARTLKEYGIPLAKVDGPREKELVDSLKIPGWPTLKVFRKGRSMEYKGPREHKGIVEHMRQLARPPSKTVESAAELKNGMSRNETTITGFFSGKTDLYEEFILVAHELRSVFTFMHTFQDHIASHYDVNPDTIVVFQPEIYHSAYEKRSFEYARPGGTAQDIMEFIRQTSVPLVGQRTKANQLFKYSTRPLIVIYYDVNFDHQYVKDTQIIRQRILQVANQYEPRTVRFAICNEDEFVDELRSLNLADATEDVKVAAFANNMKFRMEPVDDFEVQHLQTFLASLTTGKVKPFFKSQPIPKVQEGPVRAVVADSFTEEVLKSKKDVLIEFYAPWCGACKKLAPDYAKLARRMKKDNPDLLVAKMDATANDLHPMFGEIKGYPTIFFVPVTNKEDVIPYQGGELTYKALKAFVNEHASLILSEEERMGMADQDESDGPKRPTDEL